MISVVSFQIMGPASRCAESLGTQLCAPAFLAMLSWQTAYPVKVSATGAARILVHTGVWDKQNEGGGLNLKLIVLVREQVWLLC